MIMDPDEVRHFCSGYVKGRTPQRSFRDWSKSLANGQRFTEGATRYNEYRDLSLGEVERLILLSASHYRRVHDGFADISSAWAYVTLYYGSFFSARALMGLFGVWLTDKRKCLAVLRTSPGTQQFESRAYASPTGAGSHAQFWELYYDEMSALVAYLDVEDKFAVQLPGADYDWQISERNRLNYDSFEAIDLAEQFGSSFSKAVFPGSLPGVLNTQYRFLEVTLRLCTSYAHQFGLNTDAVDAICALPQRIERVKQLIQVQKPHSMGGKAKKKVMYG